MSTSVRAQVADELIPLLPDTWDFKAQTVKTLDTIPRTTAFLEHTGLENTPAAPHAHINSTLVLTVLSARQDYAYAEDEIDAAVVKVALAIDESDFLNFARAEKVAIGNYLGWSVTLTATTSKEA